MEDNITTVLERFVEGMVHQVEKPYNSPFAGVGGELGYDNYALLGWTR
jgi:hypothetical protein